MSLPTALVIPAFNEEKHLESVFLDLQKQKISLPVVVVDDGSKDRTVEIAQRYTSHVIRHGVNTGKGGAMLTGAEYALRLPGIESFVFLDGDGQHNPAEIKLFLEKLDQGHDLVFEVRNIWQKMPRSRSLGNHALSRFIQWRYGVYIPDILSGFKGFSRAGFESVRWQALGYEVEMEIAARVAQQKLPYTTLEIETIYHDFERGMNVLDALRLISKLPLWP
ncbi:glycosyltransferase family 2 protein [Candidatus Woesebacteria bacterium]|nr:glycosyltransferase family 2 protein [Candidatus Woesebacteria bacterium]MCD8506892.1 glycosyltransferase family 2 protein [Candidatus Woesebacteria bacterium]MCD8527489.1 glycosyltransferase family 2 protein [Candidatus Woesebacteria bacterium]MCD8546230.1 glycosyltransferase family 2 protein [Candidatus Woesebacteria bacterium]